MKKTVNLMYALLFTSLFLGACGRLGKKSVEKSQEEKETIEQDGDFLDFNDTLDLDNINRQEDEDAAYVEEEDLEIEEDEV